MLIGLQGGQKSKVSFCGFIMNKVSVLETMRFGTYCAFSSTCENANIVWWILRVCNISPSQCYMVYKTECNSEPWYDLTVIFWIHLQTRRPRLHWLSLCKKEEIICVYYTSRTTTTLRRTSVMRLYHIHESTVTPLPWSGWAIEQNDTKKLCTYYPRVGNITYTLWIDVMKRNYNQTSI